MPASVTRATRWPASQQVDDGAGLRRPRCGRARPPARGPVMPAWVSSLRVRRVSSQAMTSAPASASTARGDRSPRLPIGVATRTSRPGGPSSHSPLISSWSPGAQPPALEGAGLGLDHAAGPQARAPSGGGAIGHVRQHDHASPVAEGDVDGEAHAEGVHRPGRAQQQGAVDAVPPEQPRGPPPPRSATSSAASTSPSRRARPRHQTLKRISRTSPSTTS